MVKKVAGIVLFKENKILLQLRTDDAPTYPSKWSFFGGGIEEGETPIEAVKRECFEELCYKLENPELIITEQISNKGTVYLFMEKYNPEQKLEQKEGKDMAWFTINEAIKLDFSPELKPLINRIRV